MGEIQDKKIVAELCGAIIGDGWIQSNEKSCFIAGDPIEDKEYYDLYLSKLISKTIKKVETKEFPYWKVYGVSIHGKENIQKLLNFGLPKGNKALTAKILSWIKNSNEEVKRAFIRGLFDTDGSISCQKDYTKYADRFNSYYHTKIRIRLTSISHLLINETSKILKELNYRCVTRTIKRGYSNRRNNHDVNILEINRIPNIKRFMEEISPENLKHITRYDVWKRFGFCPPHTTISQRKDILKNKLNPYNLYKRG